MTNIEKINILKKLPCFKELQISDLLLMGDAIKHAEFKESRKLYNAGSYVNQVFFFVNGCFESKGGKKYESIFGLDHVLNDKVIETDVKVFASSKTVVFFINKKHFFTILKEVPQFTVSLIKEMGLLKNKQNKK